MSQAHLRDLRNIAMHFCRSGKLANFTLLETVDASALGVNEAEYKRWQEGYQALANAGFSQGEIVRLPPFDKKSNNYAVYVGNGWYNGMIEIHRPFREHGVRIYLPKHNVVRETTCPVTIKWKPPQEILDLSVAFKETCPTQFKWTQELLESVQRGCIEVLCQSSSVMGEIQSITIDGTFVKVTTKWQAQLSRNMTCWRYRKTNDTFAFDTCHIPPYVLHDGTILAYIETSGVNLACQSTVSLYPQGGKSLDKNSIRPA